MKTRKISGALFIFILVITGCNRFTNESEDLHGSASIKFLLTDSPDRFQQVNIDVRSVQVLIDDSLITLDTYSGIYNLLEFVNGKDTLVVNDDIPTGRLSQVRLILGDNNSIMADSVLYDLKIPSGQESGLKLLVHRDIVSGQAYTYVIDFDAARSIVRTGHGEYGRFILKPVVRVVSESLTGSIKGVVQPADARPTVTAVGSNDTTTVFADPYSGKFKIRCLNPGSYDLEFHPDSAYSDTTLFDVQVMAGETTVLDTLWFK
jgi:hypothetical protein